MTPYQPFLISAFVTGLDTAVQPWILPQDAFPNITNAYIFHGVLTKRSGMVDFANMVYSDNPAPTNPIMGIKTFVDTNNVTQLLIFDTNRAAIYNTSTNVFDPLDTSDIFAGNNTSFISSDTFGKTNSFPESTFFFTNFNGNTSLPISPIRTFTTIIPSAVTTEFLPNTTPTTSNNYVIGAQFIFSFRSRLLLLNTVESTIAPTGSPPIGTGTNFAQRVRWSTGFNPSDQTFVPTSGPNSIGSWWDEITPGYGGFVDAPTSEQIIAASFLQDFILVKFTNSVWGIMPTADPALPFRWVKINSFRACEAPYAEIEYDRYVTSFGKRGIVACDRTEVVRIDEKIFDFMETQVENDFISQMYSARHFGLFHSWTLYPSAANVSSTSDFALVRTDNEGAYSIYSANVTDPAVNSGDQVNLSCLGYTEMSMDLAFQDIDAPEFSSKDDSFGTIGGDLTFGSGFFQGGDEKFLAGDQIGRILFLEEGGDDLGQPIDIFVQSASWNPYKDEGKQCQLGYVDFYIDSDESTFFTVSFFCDDIVDPYSVQQMDCLPNLGFIADIVNITLSNPVAVNAPSHGQQTGNQIYIYNLNSAEELSGGPYTITVIDNNNFTLNGIDGTAFSPYVSGGTVVLRAYNNTKTWKRAYAGGKGYEHFVQITNSGIDDNLRIHAFMPWFRPSGSRIIGG